MPGSDADVANAIMASTAELRTFPTVIARLMEVTQSDSTPMDAVVKVLASDQAIAGRILRVANSPLSGCRTSVSSLDQAVVRLGLRGIRRNALMVAVYDVFDGDIRATGDLRSRIWLHNTACACLLQLLARAYSVTDEDEAVAGALLHDVGRTMLHRYDPAGYARAVRFHRQTGATDLEAEREVFGIDHQQVGELLGERWSLPPALRAVIGHHHGPQDLSTTVRGRVPGHALVQLADYLVCFAGLEPVPGLPPEPIDFECFAAAGIDISHAAQALESLEDTLNETLSYFNLSRVSLTDHSSLFAELEDEGEGWEGALRNIRQLVEQRLADLSSFASRLTELPEPDSFESALRSLTDSALSTLSFRRLVVYTLAEPAGILVPFAVLGGGRVSETQLPALPRQAADDPIASIARGEPGRIVRSGNSFEGPTAQLLSILGSEAAAVVPIRGQRGIYGVLVADDPTSPIPPTEIDLQVLSTVGSQAGMHVDQALRAIDYAREAEELRRLAIRDPETGLYNEGFLHERLESEVSRARRTGHSFGVFALRICNYTEVAAAGDDARLDVLNRVVGTVASSLRTSDTLARLDDDLFGAILLEVDADSAGVPVHAVAESLRGTEFRDVLPGEESPVRFATAVAVFPDDAGDPAALLDAATRGTTE
jgi:diguanylate cyclase (GGDEF)-like protein/putative nucleotidyltransferase with HDIG domain